MHVINKINLFQNCHDTVIFTVADPAILKRGGSQPRVKGGFQLYSPIQMH